MNIPYFIRVKDDNEKKSKKRFATVLCTLNKWL